MDAYDKPPPYSEVLNQGPGSGFSQPQNSSAVPNYGSTVPNYGSTFPSQTTAPQVIIIGGCPACHIGSLEDDFTLLGVLCAIAFFPLGILCCLAMKRRRCLNCGAVFD